MASIGFASFSEVSVATPDIQASSVKVEILEAACNTIE